MFTANPGFTAEQAVKRLYDTATDLGAAGWDEDTGYGEVNALRAVDPTADVSGSGGSADDGKGGSSADGSSGTGTGADGKASSETASDGANGASGANGTSNTSASSQLEQSPSVKAHAQIVKYAKLKKKTQKINCPITVKGAFGKLTYKLVSVNKKAAAKKVSIKKKTGKIVLKKGLKKGSYKLKVRVSAAGNDKYASYKKTVAVKLRVK